MSNGVVVKPPQVVDGRSLQVSAFRTQPPAVRYPTNQIGECPSGMRQAKRKPGKAVEDLAEDKMRGRNRRFSGVADKVCEIEFW